MADARKPDPRFAAGGGFDRARGNPAAAAALMSAILARAGATRGECRHALLIALAGARGDARDEAGDRGRPCRAGDRGARRARAEHARHPADRQWRHAGGCRSVQERRDRRSDIRARVEQSRQRAAHDGTLRGSRGGDAAGGRGRSRTMRSAWNNLGAMLLDSRRRGRARATPMRVRSRSDPIRRRCRRSRISSGSAATSMRRSMAIPRAARASPDDANVLLQLGGALAERGDIDAAREAYRAGLVHSAAVAATRVRRGADAADGVCRRRRSRRPRARPTAKALRGSRPRFAARVPRPQCRRRHRRPALDQFPARLSGRGRSRTAGALCRDRRPSDRCDRAGVARAAAQVRRPVVASASASRRRSSAMAPRAFTSEAGSRGSTARASRSSSITCGAT